MNTLLTLALIIAGVSIIYARELDLPGSSVSRSKRDSKSCTENSECGVNGRCNGGKCHVDNWSPRPRNSQVRHVIWDEDKPAPSAEDGLDPDIKKEHVRGCRTSWDCLDDEECDKRIKICKLLHPDQLSLRQESFEEEEEEDDLRCADEGDCAPGGQCISNECWGPFEEF